MLKRFLAKKLDDFVIIYLYNIVIYIKNLNKTYINTIYLFLDVFKKYRFFINLEKF